MAAPKKATAKKKAEPKTPEPTLVDGFTTQDYEGHEMFVCDRCGFDTFSTEVAASHLAEHARTDELAELTKTTTEHLPETAQLTIEEAPDEG